MRHINFSALASTSITSLKIPRIDCPRLFCALPRRTFRFPPPFPKELHIIWYAERKHLDYLIPVITYKWHARAQIIIIFAVHIDESDEE